MEKLTIYQKGLNLVKTIYDLIRNHPDLAKDYSLNDQLKRASVSVVANIGEGYVRKKKQSQYYLHISSGSSNEMVTLLKIVSLVHGIETEKTQEEYIVLGKQINAFAKSF